MATIIPAILVQTAQEFHDRLAALPPSVDTVSVDIMDGTFVEPTTFYDVAAAHSAAFEGLYELDLMVNDPLPIIRAWASHPRTTRAIVHAEIPQDLRDLIGAIHALHLEAGLALLPSTPVHDVEHLFNELDMILIRGNDPGYAGRPFLPEMLNKIAAVRAIDTRILIEVDIGVNEQTIPDIVKAGATHLAVNSAIFSEKDPAETFERLEIIAA